MNPLTPEPDPVFSSICEASARLMSGAVNRSAMKGLQRLVHADSSAYPWQEVVEQVLATGPEPAELTKAALKSQRDWIVRGGRENPRKSVRFQAKTLVAVLLARLIFMSILVPCLLAVLVLCKLRWPEFDIYAGNDWLATTWPGVFGPK